MVKHLREMWHSLIPSINSSLRMWTSDALGQYCCPVYKLLPVTNLFVEGQG